ncbi:type II toxin-antitoxin system ParD family antitoxin [Aquibium microcysteis]|uniref:type II toxin-antitoxin system ParD family antitoxin n=1 Tax=Aquibium microcysteis TaxID=675281 RepID=UPI00165CF5BE|nr:type II toxin-antitoxin system ParD family antitoxin [Aquibium microcysteis]
MPATEKRTFTLPVDQSSFIDQMVESGSYESASDVVRAGLRALQERDEAVERWLRDEVAPVYDAMKADPSRGIPAEDALAAVRARHAARLKENR